MHLGIFEQPAEDDFFVLTDRKLGKGAMERNPLTQDRSKPLLFQFLHFSLEEHLFQPKIKPIQEDLVSLANHIAFRAYGKCFLGIDGH